jgi:hypothetical protein
MLTSMDWVFLLVFVVTGTDLENADVVHIIRGKWAFSLCGFSVTHVFFPSIS